MIHWESLKEQLKEFFKESCYPLVSTHGNQTIHYDSRLFQWICFWPCCADQLNQFIPWMKLNPPWLVWIIPLMIPFDFNYSQWFGICSYDFCYRSRRKAGPYDHRICPHPPPLRALPATAPPRRRQQPRSLWHSRDHPNDDPISNCARQQPQQRYRHCARLAAGSRCYGPWHGKEAADEARTAIGRNS